jgi:quinol-cytochrome oxidoreductase complex cytochrome b subunit
MLMLMPKVFGLILAAAVLGTSIMIFVMGARFQQVEQAAYAGKRRPWWFYLGGAVFAVLYIITLAGFIAGPDKTWAGWVLVVVIPVGAVLKGSLVIFNKEGQKKVTSIEGDAAWRKIALTRVILAPLFLVLAYFA